jgi:hypothetical protein
VFEGWFIMLNVDSCVVCCFLSWGVPFLLQSERQGERERFMGEVLYCVEENYWECLEFNFLLSFTFEFCVG